MARPSVRDLSDNQRHGTSPSDYQATKIIGLIVMLAALLYGAAHLLWYWQTPFGTAPVLDERENLNWAAHIANGSLPPEPFFRAMLYPLLLAAVSKLGISAAGMPMAATLLGLGLHLINSMLVARIALAFFRNPTAALVAGLAHGLNPVLIHFATQILDNTLANTGFLLGLWVLALRFRGEPSRQDTGWSILAAVSWTLAALTRPQLLVLLPALPILWWLARPTNLCAYGKHLLAAILTIGLLLSAQGLWQKSVCGSFRLLPAQAAYNLWSANRPGADGRYFSQTLRTAAGPKHANPAGEEAVLLYIRETGQQPESPDEVNRHWQFKLLTRIQDEPGAWLRLLGRKAYYLFNDFEAYNNKTYAFHQARSPWLSPNPISWGLLLTASIVGIAVLISRYPRGALLITATFSVIAASILLTYVSGRFRLPLTALLCLLSGGLPLAGWLSPRARLITATLVIGVAALTFSDFAGARDTKTFLQDELLLAGSALESGDDEMAWQAASEALSRSPRHPDAQAQRITAGFNLLISGKLGPAREKLWQSTASELVVGLAEYPQIPMVEAIVGLACWRAGDREAALDVWKTQAATPNGQPSACALLLAQHEDGAASMNAPDAGSNNAFGLMLQATLAPDPTNHELRLLADRLFTPAPTPSSP